MKRIFDVVSAATGLFVFALPMLGIAALIKVTSPGPVLYRGERVGRHGVRFQMLKFRTMVDGAERLGGTSTGRGDPRVTAIGSWLRKYKLDELPQLINVMKGEMSIVGPRPEVAEYADLYTGDELLILTVRPGITDYSSIKFRNLADVIGDDEPDRVFAEQVLPEKNRLRVEYVRRRSFLEDLRIIVQTLHAVARR